MLGAVCPGEGQPRCGALYEPGAWLGTRGLSQPGRGFVRWFQGIGWTGREQLEPGAGADRQGGEGGDVEVGRVSSETLEELRGRGFQWAGCPPPPPRPSACQVVSLEAP